MTRLQCPDCSEPMPMNAKKCSACGWKEKGYIEMQRCKFEDSGRKCPYVADHHSTLGYCYYHARHDHEWGARLLDDLAYNGFPKHWSDKEVERRMQDHRQGHDESKAEYQKRVWAEVKQFVAAFGEPVQDQSKPTPRHNADEEESRRIIDGYLHG